MSTTLEGAEIGMSRRYHHHHSRSQHSCSQTSRVSVSPRCPPPAVDCERERTAAEESVKRETRHVEWRLQQVARIAVQIRQTRARLPSSCLGRKFWCCCRRPPQSFVQKRHQSVQMMRERDRFARERGQRLLGRHPEAETAIDEDDHVPARMREN